MIIIAKILIVLIAIFHIYILWLEMFAWTTKGPSVFRQFPKDLFPATKTMAANQGLYNGFLAAGLIWSLFIRNEIWSDYVAIFFLSCVAIAGIFGALTASKKIFYLQGLPAIAGIVIIVLR